MISSKKSKKMKCSLIISTYNDEKIISEQINSILNQTHMPDEIIILDAISRDNTASIIKSFKNRRIKLIEMDVDIGTGRNVAISEAENNLILVTDGGCLLERKWVEKMLDPFKNSEVYVVGGVFEPLAKNYFEKCEGLIVCKSIEKIDEKKFLPSSRSLAFRKEAWKSVGGYPVHNIGGEDTLFNLKLKEKGYKIYITKEAVVKWEMRSPLTSFIHQFFLYGVGDARNGNIFKMKINFIFSVFSLIYFLSIISLVFFYYTASLFLMGLVILYLSYKGLTIAIKTKKILGFFYGFILEFFKRVAYVSGVWKELLFEYKGSYRNENF